MSVKLSGGANFGGTGETTATLKAVTSGDMIYFLLQYADPTQSIRRGPLQKQADGSWKKLSDPNDKGGDDNVYYEDKWSIIWNVNDSIAGFNQNGCAVLCHVGEGKPFGNKYTAKAGEIGDMWHMKGSRNGVFGQVDDQYVDTTRYDKDKSPNAGRKGDPGGPDYKSFGLVNGKPEFMNKDGKPANAGGTYYIKDGDQVAFDDSKFKAGDEVASYIVYKLQGRSRRHPGGLPVAERHLDVRNRAQAHDGQPVRHPVRRRGQDLHVRNRGLRQCAGAACRRLRNR